MSYDSEPEEFKVHRMGGGGYVAIQESNMAFDGCKRQAYLSQRYRVIDVATGQCRLVLDEALFDEIHLPEAIKIAAALPNGEVFIERVTGYAICDYPE